MNTANGGLRKETGLTPGELEARMWGRVASILVAVAAWIVAGISIAGGGLFA